LVRSIFAGAVVALTSLAAVAQQDPIAARNALMKANGDEAKIASTMTKGEAPFDLAAAHKVFATFEDSAQNGGDALPAEFSNRRAGQCPSEDLGQHGGL
jgi:cytochrome c556